MSIFFIEFGKPVAHLLDLFPLFLFFFILLNFQIRLWPVMHIYEMFCNNNSRIEEDEELYEDKC